ncbi:M23 family metallopeptidase [Streptomyces sp. NBRC 109706]|uniref:M23 family metallopeptidase n=1 Tax=Streptomyces sp. NBRC 109706 TaxID=1550035 RepID=UPI00099DB9F1|nr:M23 family metallopeptidase [Streptomyces sp. NBRC 109706]
MLNTTTITTRAPRTLRARAAAAVVAGACATVALTGAAVAAEGTNADAFASGTASELADTTRGQAEALRAAAESGEGTAKAAKAAETDKAADWVSPISDDYELSATYGNSGDRWAAKHSGQDFAVPSGTEVHAVHDGTVVKAGGNGAGDGPAYGNAVVIKHDDGTFSQYAHLSQVDVQVGQQVSADERIALSGNTGNSSGPHLHFEIRTSADYGTAIDPMKFLRDQDAEV